MHSGKKWRSALSLNAVLSDLVKSDEFENCSYSLKYIFFLDPDYVTARSLRSNEDNLARDKLLQ